MMQSDGDDAKILQTLLQKKLSLEDIGLRIRRIDDHSYLSVESDSMILEDTISDAVLKAAANCGCRSGMDR